MNSSRLLSIVDGDPEKWARREYEERVRATTAIHVLRELDR